MQQPGGWVFNVLAYCGSQNVRELAPTSKRPIDPLQLSHFVKSSTGLFICPAKTDPTDIVVSDRFPFVFADEIPLASRGDYAINGGSQQIDPVPGPLSLDSAVVTSFRWPDLSGFNGISYVRSRVRAGDIKDGTTYVFLIGERQSPRTERDQGANQPIFSGDCWDIRRETTFPLSSDGIVSIYPSFGSSHRGGSVFSMCDGSGAGPSCGLTLMKMCTDFSVGVTMAVQLWTSGPLLRTCWGQALFFVLWASRDSILARSCFIFGSCCK